eukprot:1035270-Prymnesium_polylepis.2
MTRPMARAGRRTAGRVSVLRHCRTPARRAFAVGAARGWRARSAHTQLWPRAPSLWPLNAAARARANRRGGQT